VSFFSQIWHFSILTENNIMIIWCLFVRSVTWVFCLLLEKINFILHIWNQFYKHFMSVFSWGCAHNLWGFIKMNFINFFHELTRDLWKLIILKILYQSRHIFHESTNQTSAAMLPSVVFSILWRIIEMKIHKNLSTMFFSDFMSIVG
jgi:hypothetical protein